MDLKSLPIGTLKEVKTQLEPLGCEVLSIDIETTQWGNKAVFSLKHPKKDEPIRVSTITGLRFSKGKKEIAPSGAWIKLDKENKISMESALAQLMRFYAVANLNEMIGKTVLTELNEDGWLTIKSY